MIERRLICLFSSVFKNTIAISKQKTESKENKGFKTYSMLGGQFGPPANVVQTVHCIELLPALLSVPIEG